MPDIKQQKQEYLSLCREQIQREGLEDLLSWLQKSDFFSAPASTKFHGAYEGGLCEHSLDVYRMALKAKEAYEKNQSLSQNAISDKQKEIEK